MRSNGLPRNRRKAEQRGRQSEWIAALWLILKGYRILALRYRTPAGEIDLVARKGALLVFVEVKARRSPSAAVDAVTGTAHRRIRAASDLWLSRMPNAERFSRRYDIIAISPGRWPRHFPDAF